MNETQLTDLGGGVWSAPGARIIDRAGRKHLPIGDDGFARAMERSVLVDKTMLIADVLDYAGKCTQFCRPRRFGKTLNMTMLRAFFQILPDGESNEDLFRNTCIWDADGGRYRAFLGAYPVVFLSLRTAKGRTWEQTYEAIKSTIILEYQRHPELVASELLDDSDRAFYRDITMRTATEPQYASSLERLCTLLRKHHGKNAVVLIDEYDAPVMAAYSAPDGGYYGEAVSFLKGWLTGALKDGGEALAFACLTGVQRISKESIFSDLNNLSVSTALSADFDERFGFTDAEVEALHAYLGRSANMPEAREWYDGYRFGNASVYNPWSILNYLKQGCSPDVYWGNTSGNQVVGELVRGADADTLAQVYGLLEPGGTVYAPLDLGIVFPDLGVRAEALWSMLYLAGYLTTDDTALPNNTQVRRRLRIPNKEIAALFRAEIVERFSAAAGNGNRLDALHRALTAGNEEQVNRELGRIAEQSASSFDLTSENSWHMLMLGLCFGMSGYGDPASNREEGLGRPDIQLRPQKTLFFDEKVPLLTFELKFERDAADERLGRLADEALAQIEDRRYDADLPADAAGRMRWGIACSGKRLVARAARA